MHLKFIFFILLSALAFQNSFAQFENTTDRTGKRLLKGFVTDSILKADSKNFGWFQEHEALYTPANSIVKTFSENRDSINFMIFFGTWCADSHYVIPRFYKIIEKSGFNKNHITLFGLDRTKKDAAHFATNFNIAHVPTIIVLKNGKEIGRVVEYGATGRFDEELEKIIHSSTVN